MPFFDNEYLQRTGSRFTDQVEFVVGVPEEIDPDWPQEDTRPDEIISDTVDGLRADLPEGRFEGFYASVGRGAEGPGLGFTLTAAATLGGAISFGHYVWRAKKWLEQRFGGAVTLSHGALKALVLYDVHRRRPDLEDGRVVVVGMTEVRHSMEPSETSHTGVDMTSIVLATVDNSESWSYMVLATGKILHDIQSGPLPPEVILFLTGEVEVDWDQDLGLPELGEDRQE